jgi:ABC-2 type transport system ATP-binding protein
MLEIRGIQKSFGSRRVLQDISLTVAEGECIGFLGRNGSGKTTTIRVILNLLRKDAGSIHFQGQGVGSDIGYLRRIGYVQQNGGLLDDLTLAENLTFFARLHRIAESESRARVLRSVRAFDMDRWTDAPIKTFSQGMKQKVKLMRALLHDPALLILDEPLTSLDPWEQENAVRVLRDFLQKPGKAVFLSSHVIPDIQKLATRILFLNEGKIERELLPRDVTEQIRSLFVKED